MNAKELTEILRDSAFKESSLYYQRNSAFLLAETLLLGFTLNSYRSDDSSSLLIFWVAIAGLVLSVCYWCVLYASKHYNSVWLQSFIEWVDKQSSDATRSADKTTDSSSQAEKSEWQHLKETLSKHEKLPLGINATTFISVIPVVFGLIWAVLIYLSNPCSFRSEAEELRSGIKIYSFKTTPNVEVKDNFVLVKESDGRTLVIPYGSKQSILLVPDKANSLFKGGK